MEVRVIFATLLRVTCTLPEGATGVPSVFCTLCQKAPLGSRLSSVHFARRRHWGPVCLLYTLPKGATGVPSVFCTLCQKAPLGSRLSSVHFARRRHWGPVCLLYTLPEGATGVPSVFCTPCQKAPPRFLLYYVLGAPLMFWLSSVCCARMRH